jgi:hypothetical protein
MFRFAFSDVAWSNLRCFIWCCSMLHELLRCFSWWCLMLHEVNWDVSSGDV